MFKINVVIPSPRKLYDVYKRWRTPPPKIVLKKVFKDYQTGLYRTASRLPPRPRLIIPPITAIPADVERPAGCNLPVAPPHIPSSSSSDSSSHWGKIPKHGVHRTSSNRQFKRSFGSWAKSRDGRYIRAYGAEYGSPLIPGYAKLVRVPEGEEDGPNVNEPVTPDILKDRKEHIRDASDLHSEIEYQEKRLQEAYEKDDERTREWEVKKRLMVQEILEAGLKGTEEREMRRLKRERMKAEQDERNMRARRVAEQLAQQKRQEEAVRVEREKEVERMRRRAEKMREEERLEQLRKAAEEAEWLRQQARERERIRLEREQAKEKFRRFCEQREREEAAKRQQRQREEEAKRHRQQQQRQQKRAESDEASRLRATRSLNSRFTSPADITAYYNLYVQKWDLLTRPTGELPQIISAAEIPWPVLGKIKTQDDITYELVRDFIMCPCRPGMEGWSVKKRVKAELLKWHPDKFMGRVVGRLSPWDVDPALECAGRIVRWLNEMMSETGVENKV